MLKLSVIIPTYNRRQVLERTLPLLLAQGLPADEYEIIVVVNGSTDGTDDLLNSLKPRCTLKKLAAQPRGAGAARNVGIRAAAGELVLFLDDDLLCAPDLLRQHVAAHPGPEPRVVHGPIYVAPDSARSMIRHVTETFYETYYRPLDPAMEFRYPGRIDSSLSVLSSLVNSSMPRHVLLQCEGFDEEILAAEDLELGLRLWKAGCVFGYLPAAAAYEYYVKNSRHYLHAQAVAVAAGDLRASRKHPEYRPCSSLASLGETWWGKRWLLHALVGCPVSPVPLIAFPLRFEKWMYPLAPLRRAGVHLLNLAERLTRLRSAAQTAGSWQTIQSEFGRRCPVLLYHHVGPLREGTYHQLTISAKAFARQIRWLARRGYTGILPSDWLRWLRDGTGLPRKPIMITFDDGYADIAQYALPILRRYGFGATVFIVTARTGGTNTWDEARGCGTL
ncbi:MAG: glycosyltransferase, partial [Terracidiphilus sp.]